VKADITPAALEERALVQAFGARVRTSRIEQGLPQTELAALANVTVSWITRIEQGRHRTNVSLAMIQRLARALEMTYDELLDGLPVVSQRHSWENRRRRVPLIPPKTDPRPAGNWSYERTRGLVDMRNEGMTHAEIAERLHVSVRAVEEQIGALVFRGAIPSRRELLTSSVGASGGNAPAVERLYKRNWPLQRMAFALDIGHSELQRVKARLHEAGMPRRRYLTDGQVRAIHIGHLEGGGIDLLAAELGFRGSTARVRLGLMGLPVGRQAREAYEQEIVTLEDRIVERESLIVPSLAHAERNRVE
jgi:transcriptional regulator with XRE-family HTH domain